MSSNFWWYVEKCHPTWGPFFWHPPRISVRRGGTHGGWGVPLRGGWGYPSGGWVRPRRGRGYPQKGCQKPRGFCSLRNAHICILLKIAFFSVIIYVSGECACQKWTPPRKLVPPKKHSMDSWNQCCNSHSMFYKLIKYFMTSKLSLECLFNNITLCFIKL